MYSWIASFFNETESDSNLYVKQQQQDGSQPQEEWTWIEVIEDREEDGLIIVQTDESTRNNNINGSHNIVTKRKRRIQKSEAISRKVFKKSLYADLPLMRKSCGMKFTRKLKLNAQVKNLYKKTTSEVLSSTFPMKSGLLKINQELEFDITYLLNNTTFLKSLLEGILKHEARLDGSLHTWLESIVQSTRIQQRQKQLAIEWNKRQPLCIEWYKDDKIKAESFDSDDLEITEVRYPLPRWLKRLNVDDERSQFPEYMEHINVSAFHDACGEHHCPVVDYVENITYVPRWLRRMDVCEPSFARDRHAAVHKIPKWMQKIDLFNDHEEEIAFPAWMNRIDLFEDEKQDFEYYPRYQLRGSKSWVPSSSYYSADWISAGTREWIRPITSDMSLVNNAQTLCNSVINFAMVLATATCTAADEQCQKLETIRKCTITEQSVSSDQKNRRRISTISALQSSKSNVKKNKKWLNKINNVAKLQSKRKRYAPKSFSGRKCVRAC